MHFFANLQVGLARCFLTFWLVLHMKFFRSQSTITFCTYPEILFLFLKSCLSTAFRHHSWVSGFRWLHADLKARIGKSWPVRGSYPTRQDNVGGRAWLVVRRSDGRGLCVIDVGKRSPPANCHTRKRLSFLSKIGGWKIKRQARHWKIKWESKTNWSIFKVLTFSSSPPERRENGLSSLVFTRWRKHWKTCTRGSSPDDGHRISFQRGVPDS